MRKLICIAILIAVNALLLGYSMNFDFSYVVNGGDTQLLLNPVLFIYRSFFVWEDTISGVAMLTPASLLPYSTLLYLFNSVFSINIASFLFFVTLFSLSSVSMFLLSDSILQKTNSSRKIGIAFFTGIFYSFNLFTAIEFHTPVGHILYLYGITPALVLVFVKFMGAASVHSRLAWLLFYALLSWPLTRIINMFLLYLMLVPIVGFILGNRLQIQMRKFAKYWVLFIVIVCLIALPTMIMFPFAESMPLSLWYSKSAAQVELGNKLSDSIRFMRTLALEYAMPERFGGILSYSFLVDYQSNVFLIFVTFYPILMLSFLLLFCFPKLINKDRLRISAFLLLALLSLAFATPSLTPLGEFSVQNDIYILRSAWKYFSIPYILSLSITLTILLKYLIRLSRKTYAIFLISLFLLHAVYIAPALLIYGRAINQAWIVKIPQDYYDLADFLNKDQEDYRILPVPMTKHFAGYVPYTWGYVGPDVLYTLIDKPTLDKQQDVIASKEYLDLINQIDHASLAELLDIAKITNVRYILLREDVDMNHPYIKLSHPPQYYKEFLENSEAVGAKYVFGNLTLYELEDNTPRIFIQPTDGTLPSSDLQEIFSQATHRSENITYMWFNENPLSLRNSIQDIQNFSLNIKFKLLYKNATNEDWQITNHVLVQTELLKIAVSPKGWLYVFLYYKNGTFLSVVTPFERMEKICTLRISFNNTFSVYMDQARIYQTTINATTLTNKITKIIIGSNFGNTEKLVGNLYNLSLTVNNEKIVNNQMLFSGYSDYIRQEEANILSLNPININWQKDSPTLYHISIDNTQTYNKYFLVFLSTYDQYWEAYITKDGKTSQIPEEQHLKAFNYANAWYINETGLLDVAIEYKPQRWFFYGSIISVTTFLACLVYAAYGYSRGRGVWKRVKHVFIRNKQQQEMKVTTESNKS